MFKYMMINGIIFCITIAASFQQSEAQENELMSPEGDGSAELLASVNSSIDIKSIMSNIVEGEITTQSIDVDYDVPASPAFVALGQTPESVVKPGTMRNLAIGLLNGTDENGNIKTGLALDFLPYLTLMDGNLKASEFRSPSWSHIERVLALTQISIATSKGLEDSDESLRFSIGLRSNLVGTNPREDVSYVECVLNSLDIGDSNIILLDMFAELNLSADDIDQYEIREDVKRKVDNFLGEHVAPAANKASQECLRKFEQDHQNEFKFDLGIASTLTSPDGGLDDISYGGTAIWTSASFGFGDKEVNLADLSQIGSALANAKVITHGRYRMGELKTDEATMTSFTQDQYLIGGQIRLGSNSLHLDLEGAYVHEDRKDGFDDQSYAKFSANLGFRLSDKTWFALTVGTTDGKRDDDSIFALGKLKYAFTTQNPFGE